MAGLSHNGGYLAASSHTIVDAMPTENYLALINTTVEYGTF